MRTIDADELLEHVYTLCVGYWRTGEGWRRIDNNERIEPEYVAQINLLD